ncbi:Alpha/Beta hydrolase protein [Talaromyces proteolyticus]|uniref:Alpha/Beta hydrolase protein n=1 Tax=Talaromyces proteolyticus TaxID=1131652 RepID=A0AAD4PYL5_9EURO|nr:Alpha/Beta hydrolase protein [Talaromyces proteolyticus]KAH8695293.1 Alpha/Beta hydrolase protein [Talaromyces proteolyticus]
MATPKTAQFGTWESPINIETITAESTNIIEVTATANGKIYTVEAPPSVDGRCTIIEYQQGKSREVLPPDYSARTAVHGYGGAAIETTSKGAVIFADWNTKGVFSLDPTTKKVTAVLTADPQVFFADFDVHPHHPEWILAIRENHHSQPEEENSLVAINSADQTIHVLASGADFYTSPRFSPTGDRISWTQWNHPDMPWTGTKLFVGYWKGDGTLSDVKEIDGEARNVSINQPKWGPDGTLFYISDRSGYWQLQALRQDSAKPETIILDGLEKGEFSSPEWRLGSSTFISLTSDTIVATWIKDAKETLISIDLPSSKYSVLSDSLTGINGHAVHRLSDTSFVVIADSPTVPKALYHVELSQPRLKIDILKSSLPLDIPDVFYSQAEHISFPRTEGSDQLNTTSHAFYLPPKNANYVGTPGALPPLIIDMHGGPTTHTSPGLALTYQYYTSRGYAVALPNYAGSSGYGRKYRDLLDGAWGALDPADAASCVTYLVKTGRVDGSRVGIMGGSSGGHAALEAIWMFPSVWSAAVSRYGISDLEILVEDTHKFEKHYAFRLLFADNVPDDEDQRRRVYRQRSPRFHSKEIRAPVLLLQGSEDRVVPPNQTEMMVRSITENGGIAKMTLFEGEGHGFRGKENQRRALEEQDQWWQKYLVRAEEA